MKHKHGIKKIGKNNSHRRSALANMAQALFEHGRIYTTLPKARALRPYAEKLITRGKKGDLNSRRLVLGKLYDKDITHKLFDTIAPLYKERPGGYIRILKGNHRVTGKRLGDNAKMAMVELVDYDLGTTSASES